MNKFEVLFTDSSEYYYIDNARMFQEGNLVVFKTDEETIYYPMCNIYRIKAIANN